MSDPTTAVSMTVTWPMLEPERPRDAGRDAGDRPRAERPRAGEAPAGSGAPSRSAPDCNRLTPIAAHGTYATRPSTRPSTALKGWPEQDVDQTAPHRAATAQAPTATSRAFPSLRRTGPVDRPTSSPTECSSRIPAGPGARLQREHQWPPPPILPEAQRPPPCIRQPSSPPVGLASRPVRSGPLHEFLVSAAPAPGLRTFRALLRSGVRDDFHVAPRSTANAPPSAGQSDHSDILPDTDRAVVRCGPMKRFMRLG